MPIDPIMPSSMDMAIQLHPNRQLNIYMQQQHKNNIHNLQDAIKKQRILDKGKAYIDKFSNVYNKVYNDETEKKDESCHYAHVINLKNKENSQTNENINDHCRYGYDYFNTIESGREGGNTYLCFNDNSICILSPNIKFNISEKKNVIPMPSDHIIRGPPRFILTSINNELSKLNVNTNKRNIKITSSNPFENIENNDFYQLETNTNYSNMNNFIFEIRTPVVQINNSKTLSTYPFLNRKLLKENENKKKAKNTDTNFN